MNALSRRAIRDFLVRLGVLPRSRFSSSDPDPHSLYSSAYPDWESARRDADGWDSPVVLDKVRTATLEVLQGTGAYERDGTSFPKLPKADTLRRLLAELASPNSWIIDFGGGLGGTWINNRDILPAELKFTVIEQPSFCEEGRRIAADYGLQLQYSTSLDELAPNQGPDLVILSGVLCYIQDWDEVVASIVRLQPENIIVDRQVLTAGDDVICLQSSENYYARPVSYPLRIINVDRFVSAFVGYRIRQRWASDFDPPDHLGFHFVRASKQ